MADKPSAALALAIANEFLQRHSSKFRPAQMQLQKWVFNAHGWNLAVNKQPLIAERAQAWDNGPVYRSIWNHLRDYGYDKESCLLVDPVSKRPFRANLSQKEVDVIDRTWKKYQDYSGLELSRMAHEVGTPWTRAYYGRGQNSAISDMDTQEYYTKLALAGRVG